MRARSITHTVEKEEKNIERGGGEPEKNGNLQKNVERNPQRSLRMKKLKESFPLGASANAGIRKRKERREKVLL